MPTSTRRLRQQTKKIANHNGADDPQKSAEEAGLRYVTDEQPGYTRKRHGEGFQYFDTEEKLITDEQRILRLNRLAIPPAYTHVWICPSPNGHLQATGRDDRGRKQYRYHDRWREVRDENKYERIVLFGQILHKIRRRVKRDMALRGLPKAKVLATVVHLLERSFIRVGNPEYARENKSFGLTTMRNRHVEVKGGSVRFQFKGKSGVNHQVDVNDRRVAKVIKKLTDLPGQELFQYLDEEGERHAVTSEEVNDYLREISGYDFTAKDFRTWAGTVLAAMALAETGAFDNKTQAKKNVSAAIGAVAKILGNTPAVCRKCYVHPLVLETYVSGASIEGLKQRTEETLTESLNDLSAAEAVVLTFLRTRLARKK